MWGIWGIPMYGNPARPWRTWTSWPLRLCRTWTFWHRYIDILYMGHSGTCTCQTMVLLAATTIVLLVFGVFWRCVSFEMLSCRASPLQEGIDLDLVDRADRNLKHSGQKRWEHNRRMGSDPQYDQHVVVKTAKRQLNYWVYQSTVTLLIYQIWSIADKLQWRLTWKSYTEQIE